MPLSSTLLNLGSDAHTPSSGHFSVGLIRNSLSHFPVEVVQRVKKERGSEGKEIKAKWRGKEEKCSLYFISNVFQKKMKKILKHTGSAGDGRKIHVGEVYYGPTTTHRVYSMENVWKIYRLSFFLDLISSLFYLYICFLFRIL